MSVTYQQLLHSVAIRLNALVGTQVATIAASYDTAVLTSAQFKSADWPFNSFRDAILIAEEDFAWAIADTANHPWRSNISSVTGNIADGGSIPATNGAGTSKIIGVYGSVVDAVDNTVCTEAELDEITRINRLQADGILTLDHYLYRFDDNRIRHTREDVVIGVCVYNRATQLTAFGANGEMLLPDVLEGPIVYRAVSILTKETAFADQAGVYATYANDALRRIREGLTSVGNKAIPVSAGGSA